MPRPPKTLQDATLLNAALEGLLLQRERLDEQIRQVRSLLGGRAAGAAKAAAVAPAEKPARKKRILSPEARKRIAQAQKRRWAEFRKKAEGGGE